MTVYAAKDASSFELSVNLACWVTNFFVSLGGLFISLFLLISHDDLTTGCIEPVELSNSLNQVSLKLKRSRICTSQYIHPTFILFIKRCF